MGGGRDHRGELSGIRRRRHVIGGAHQHHAGECGLVGDLVEQPAVILAAGAQRQVDDTRSLGDRPAQAGGEDQTLARQAATEDPD